MISESFARDEGLRTRTTGLDSPNRPEIVSYSVSTRSVERLIDRIQLVQATQADEIRARLKDDDARLASKGKLLYDHPQGKGLS